MVHDDVGDEVAGRKVDEGFEGESSGVDVVYYVSVVLAETMVRGGPWLSS